MLSMAVAWGCHGGKKRHEGKNGAGSSSLTGRQMLWARPREGEPDPSAASAVQVQDDSEGWGRQGVASQPQPTL